MTLVKKPDKIHAITIESRYQTRHWINHQNGLSENTLRRQRATLQKFGAFLYPYRDVDLFTMPHAWRDISLESVESYFNALENFGYTISTINQHRTTIRTYTRLANQCGYLDDSTCKAITSIKNIRYRQGVNIDDKRTTTRIGNKKSEPNILTIAQVRYLKDLPEDTPQALRDKLIVTLFADTGIRVSEMANLTTESINLDENTLTIYRQKTATSATYALTSGLTRLFTIWLDSAYAQPETPLLRGSNKSGQLEGEGLSANSIRNRIRKLGVQIGIDNLSPHDLRHTLITIAAKSGTDVFSLQDIGGWTTPTMAHKYRQQAAIANENIKLPDGY